MDSRDIRVMSMLYRQPKEQMGGGDQRPDKNREWSETRLCVLRRLIVPVYPGSNAVMLELAEYEGVKFGGKNVNNIRCTNYVVMVANNKKTL